MTPEMQLAIDYYTYSLDNDPIGIEGILIADRVMKHFHSDLGKIHRWNDYLARGLYLESLAIEREIQ